MRSLRGIVQMSSKKISSIKDISDRYDYFIIDLWGVVHDGTALYPDSLDGIKKLTKDGKKIVFLSNAPRRKKKVIERLEEFGIARDNFIDVVSSGELLFHDIANTLKTSSGKYLYIGADKDQDIIDGLGYEITFDVNQADFILCTDLEEGLLDISDQLKHTLAVAKEKNIVMLCANPDIYIIKQTGEQIYCAGYVGEYYQNLGGKVIRYGKPTDDGYLLCMELFGNPDKAKILAIGDSFYTDISGASNFGIDCLMTICGVHSKDLKDISNLDNLIKQYGVSPAYYIDCFRY